MRSYGNILYLTFQDIQRVVKVKTLLVSILLFFISVTILTIAIYKIDDTFYKILVSTIGSALLGASVILVIDRLFFNDDNTNQIRTIINDNINLVKLEGHGLVGITHRYNVNFLDLLNNSKRYIKAMGISLPMMCEEKALSILLKRLQNSADPIEIKILLLNPLSVESYSRSRASCYRDSNHYTKFLNRCIEQFIDFGQTLNDKGNLDCSRFDVRLYNSIPYSSIIITDSTLNNCGFLEVIRGSSGINFELKDTRTKNDLYSTYNKHFNLIWGKSISIFEKGLEAKLKIESDNRLDKYIEFINNQDMSIFS